MPRIKNRFMQIPGGYVFSLPPLNWKAPPFQSFDNLCRMVAQVVNANQNVARAQGWPTGMNDIIDWVDRSNAEYCQAHGWNDYVTQESNVDPPKAPPPQQLFKRLVAGVRANAEMMGAGVSPVAAEQAAARAEVC